MESAKTFIADFYIFFHPFFSCGDNVMKEYFVISNTLYIFSDFISSSHGSIGIIIDLGDSVLDRCFEIFI